MKSTSISAQRLTVTAHHVFKKTVKTVTDI